MKVGSLFAGIGGFDLGLEWAGMKTVWQVEKDEFCQKVLAKHWPDVKRYGDIHDFIKECEAGAVEPVDLIAGGPPCQPFSTASSGKRRGTKDDNHLWPRMLQVVTLLRPTWVLFENVAGAVSLVLGEVVSDLENCGYEVSEPLEIPACAVGQDHWRPRYWILAHSNSNGESSRTIDAKVAELSRDCHLG